jgi:succinate dehydrogenase (ubiquinone) cytochrome b560 subunit
MSLQVIKKASTAAPQKTLAKALSTASYSERQARLGRPVSPHVEIYSFPITAISSVSNRFASMGLSVGFTAASALAAVGVDIPSLVYAAQDAIPGFAPFSKGLVAFPISYHLMVAMRRMVRLS